MRTHRTFGLCGTALVATTAPAQGIPPSPTPALVPVSGFGGVRDVPLRQEQDPAQRLLQEQRDEQRQREMNQASPQIATPELPPLPDVPVDADIETRAETGPTFFVERIRFDGDIVVRASNLDDVVAPFLHKHLGRNRINTLLRRLTQLYIDAGYITTRAYLGQQNLASGTLTVTVVPGRIQALILNGAALRPVDPTQHGYRRHGGGLLTDAGTAWAFPRSIGDVLRLQDLEQGVDQINRLRRNHAEIQILPGQASGDSIISVTNRYGGPVSYHLGVDNYGGPRTGRMRYRARVEADNVIGLQESLSLSFVGSHNTNALVASGVVPYGNQTFSYSTSLSEYQHVMGGVALLWGRTLSQILGWNHVLARSKTGRLSLDVTLTKMRTARTVNDSDLAPQNLTVAHIGLSGVRHFGASGGDAALSAGIGVARGLPWLDATRDSPDTPGEDAHGQFAKYDSTLSLTLPLPRLLDYAFTYRTRVVAQYSRVALFDSQRIFLGGMDTVRGFLEGGISGDSGFYMRNEVAWNNAPVLRGVRWEPYVFVDGATAHLTARAGSLALAGTGFGARARWKAGSHDMSCELLVGRALAQPNSLGSKASVALATLNFSG